MADDEKTEPGTGAAQDLEGADIKAADFPDLSGAGSPADTRPDLDLIRDIEVTLRVELGRTDMLIEEVMALSPGQVIELDKLAGEPLDILINNKLLAKGEVVVVDDNFGVRITSILDPRSRVQAMGKGVEAEAEAGGG